jgi:extradiol dioxygenase family protein
MSDTSDRPRFHLAFPVDDLSAARHFYGEVLGCPEGRSAEHWIDFDLFGHQIVAHLVEQRSQRAHNPVDGDEVPVPHFGLLLRPTQWQVLADRLRAAGTEFVIEPHTRFAGQPGEQSTMFVLDPAGNALEFKAFENDAQVFAR